jgi:hypothetical protein
VSTGRNASNETPQTQQQHQQQQRWLRVVPHAFTKAIALAFTLSAVR